MAMNKYYRDISEKFGAPKQSIFIRGNDIELDISLNRLITNML